MANDITAVLKNKLAPLALDIAASLLGFDKIPAQVFGAIRGLRVQIDGKINLVIDKVVFAVQNALNKVLSAVGAGGAGGVPAAAANYTGLIGNVVPFTAGGVTYRLWAVAATPAAGSQPALLARFILASSTQGDLNVSVTAWQAQAQTDPTMRALLNAEAAAQATLQTALNAANAAYQTLQLDQVALANLKGTSKPSAKAVAAAEAKVKTDLAALGKATTTLTTLEGKTAAAAGAGAAPAPTTPGALAADVAACINGACFGAGTKLLTRSGWKVVEEIGTGDEVASRHESDDPTGSVEWKEVEAKFRADGPHPAPALPRRGVDPDHARAPVLRRRQGMDAGRGDPGRGSGRHAVGRVGERE